MNQPPAAPPAWDREVCTESGIAQHWQKLHNTDSASPTPQALLNAVCTCVPLARRVPERSTAVAVCAGCGERCFQGEEGFVSSRELGWPGEPLSVPVLAASRARRDTDLHPPRPSVPLSPPSCEPARSGSWGLYKGRETSANSKESLGAGGALPPSCLHVIQLPHAGSRGQASL